MKRIFDLFVSTILIIACLPISLIIGILIRLDSPGAIIYFSPRVGRYGKQFGLVRFRTMKQICDPALADGDYNATRVGRFIRNYSLDDLPNLLNVFTGDLSLIGPRPTEPHLVDLAHPEWEQILSVRPGMFSYAIWALARDFNASDQAIKRKLELEYVEKHSMAFDLVVFGRWVQKMFVSRGNIKARGERYRTDN